MLEKLVAGVKRVNAPSTAAITTLNIAVSVAVVTLAGRSVLVRIRRHRILKDRRQLMTYWM